MNQRSQLIFLIRNLYLFLYWTLLTYQRYVTPALFSSTTVVLYRLNIKFFNRGFLNVTKKSLKKWKFFMGVNINKSIEYWIFKKSNKFLDSRRAQPMPLCLALENSPNNLNLYYNHVLISNIFLFRKPARILMFKHLMLILNFWSQWNRTHKFALQLILDINEFALLYFYNMYIFKIYQL